MRAIARGFFRSFPIDGDSREIEHLKWNFISLFLSNKNEKKYLIIIFLPRTRTNEYENKSEIEN